MPNAGSDLESTATSGRPSSTSKKLIQAAALAAMLVPLGTVAVETAAINCFSSGGACSGGSYFSGGASGQNNIWKFYADGGFTELIYTFSITGTPTTSFELSVNDFITTQGDLVTSGALDDFPNAVCIPTFDDAAGECGLFEVTVSGTAFWEDGYIAEITWFFTNSLGQPPDDGLNTILQATGGPVFTNALLDIDYDPSPTPDPLDPAIRGKGSNFSTFGAFRVPEPATLIMLGTGLIGLGYRARRRRRP